MTDFVPTGYISIREALNRIGRELFPSEWTGEEHKARRGLMSADEWLRIKDLRPARGGGAGLHEGRPAADTRPRDPSSSAYQTEYQASQRYASVRSRLRASLERGDLEAAILDPFTGILHRMPESQWRRYDADQVIDKGQAVVPGTLTTGSVCVKRFGESNIPDKRLPRAMMREVIEALKAKIATEPLTRPQQEDFVRKTFPGHHVTKRDFAEIFQQVPVPTGRPRKSNKKV